MKTPNDKLFKLIKAMDKNEKRYFKVINKPNQKGAPGKAMRLFDAIDRQITYNEDALKKKFMHDPYLGKRLNKAKDDLQTLVLKSLRWYHSESSPEHRLKNLADDADILFEKGLYAMSLAHAKRLKKLALKDEKWVWAYYAIRHERKSLILLSSPTTSHYLETLTKQQSYLAKMMANLEEYESALALIDHFVVTTSKQEQDIKKIQILLKQPILLNESNALSLHTKYFYHLIKYMYYAIVNQNPEKAYTHSKSQITLIKKISRNTPGDFTRYIDTLRSHSDLCFFLKKQTEADSSIEEIKKFLNPSYYNNIPASVAAAAFQSVYNIQINRYNFCGDLEKTIALVPEIEQGLEKYGPYLKTEETYVIFYFNLGYAYLCNAEYSNALKWLNKLINETSEDIRLDCRCMARMMILMAHYDLGNWELVESLAKSTHRYLLKNNQLLKFMDITLRFLLKRPQDKNRSERDNLFRILHGDLTIIAQDPHEKEWMTDVAVISWIESKIYNRTVTAIIKEKFIRSQV